MEHACLLGDDAATLDQPQAVTLPVTIGWRLATAGDADAYAFQATKGQKIRIDLEAQSLGFPTDATIAVLDDAGKVLAEADDNGRQRARSGDRLHRAGGRPLSRGHSRPGRPRRAADCVSADDRACRLPIFRCRWPPIRSCWRRTSRWRSRSTSRPRTAFAMTIEIHAIGLPRGRDRRAGQVHADRRQRRLGRRPARPPRRWRQSERRPEREADPQRRPRAVQPGGTPIRIEGRTAGDKPLVRTARFPLNLPLAGSHHAAWLTVK